MHVTNQHQQIKNIIKKLIKTQSGRAVHVHQGEPSSTRQASSGNAVRPITASYKQLLFSSHVALLTVTINIVGAFESSIRWIMDHASIGLRAYGQLLREYNRYQLSAERFAEPKHAFSLLFADNVFSANSNEN